MNAGRVSGKRHFSRGQPHGQKRRSGEVYLRRTERRGLVTPFTQNHHHRVGRKKAGVLQISIE